MYLSPKYGSNVALMIIEKTKKISKRAGLLQWTNNKSRRRCQLKRPRRTGNLIGQNPWHLFSQLSQHLYIVQPWMYCIVPSAIVHATSDIPLRNRESRIHPPSRPSSKIIVSRPPLCMISNPPPPKKNQSFLDRVGSEPNRVSGSILFCLSRRPITAINGR